MVAKIFIFFLLGEMIQFDKYKVPIGLQQKKHQLWMESQISTKLGDRESLLHGLT